VSTWDWLPKKIMTDVCGPVVDVFICYSLNVFFNGQIMLMSDFYW
jgi:hypothetical protein